MIMKSKNKTVKKSYSNPKGMKYAKEWLTRDELKKLFAHPNLSTRDLLLFRTCYWGGFRISEVLNSLKDDWRKDSYAYLLMREQKTEKEKWEIQPVSEFIYAEIMRYCKENGIKSLDYVFQSNRRNKMSYSLAYKILVKAVKECGIAKKINTHSFRRSRASHIIENGADIYVVSRFLRHKDIETTQIYLKISKKYLSDEVAKFDKKYIDEFF